MRTIHLFLSIVMILFFSVSCIGPQGEDGRDGIANVGSTIYDVAPSRWTGNVDGFVTTLDVPELTRKIHDNGAVLVYLLKNENTSDQSFNQLPYTWLNNSMSEYMDFDAFIGHIDITLRWVDNGMNSTEAPTGKYTFKVIVIEGTPLSMLKANTDITNPEAVEAYLSAVTLN